MNNEYTQRNFRGHDQAVRERAIMAFRGRTIRRKMTNGAAVIAVGLLLAFALAGPRTKSSTPSTAAGPVQVHVSGLHANGNTSAAQEPTPAELSEPSRELSDEQLLAVFPEGSCFIAEVNGKKTLVFHDPAVRAQFFN